MKTLLALTALFAFAAPAVAQDLGDLTAGL